MTIADAPGLRFPKGRGRRLSPISDEASSEHREWLVPLRDAYAESGLSYRKLKRLALTSEAQLSRLLTGAKDYPDLVRVLDVYTALTTVIEVPQPIDWYQKTWEAGAWAAERPQEWIKDRIARAAKFLEDPDTKPPAEGKPEPSKSRCQRGVFGFVGMVSGAVLMSVLQFLMADTGADTASDSISVAPRTSRTPMCGASVTCLITPPELQSGPELVRDGRPYVIYPAPPSTTPTGPTYAEGMVRMEDAPVYDSNHAIRRVNSKGLHVREGSTVYVQCQDEAGYLVLYGGNGDRLRSEDVVALLSATPDARRSASPDGLFTWRLTPLTVEKCQE
jgi:hypothetical protein